MEFFKKTALAALVMGFSGAALALPNITILATGGTIAGGGDSATKSNYTAGKVGVENLVNAVPQLNDAPRDKCTLSCAINGIHAAFHYLKKNYISGCVMTVPTG